MQLDQETENRTHNHTTNLENRLEALQNAKIHANRIVASYRRRHPNGPPQPYDYPSMNPSKIKNRNEGTRRYDASYYHDAFFVEHVEKEIPANHDAWSDARKERVKIQAEAVVKDQREHVLKEQMQLYGTEAYSVLALEQVSKSTFTPNKDT